MKYPLFILFLVFQINISSFNKDSTIPYRSSRLSKIVNVFKFRKKIKDEPFKYLELNKEDIAIVGAINSEKLKRCRKINLTPEIINYRNEKK